MKKIILYVYSKCSTCRKASNWLNARGINHELKDIVKEPPKEEFLGIALRQYSKDKKMIFNTRGKSFKLIDFSIETLSDNEIKKLLLNDGKLIKRPFLIKGGEKIILGFNENEYSNYFNAV